MDQSSNPLPHDTGDCSLIDSQECLTGVDRLRAGRKIARGGAYIPTLPPARSKRQVCNFRWPHVCNIRRPLTALRTISANPISDVQWLLDSTWELDAVSFADTTYVATSRDRGFVAFGDGGRPDVGRVVMWDAGAGEISSRLKVADLVGNASERVRALHLNRDGSLGMARGAFGSYFFSNDLRLRGTVPELVLGGGGGELHPDHPDTPAPAASSPTTVAFTVSGDRSIRIVDTVHYTERGRIFVRDGLRGRRSV